MLKGKTHHANAIFSETFLDSVADKPKEIEIHCPGEQPPIVSIKDLINDVASSAFESGGDCMVFKLTGQNFNLRLALNCDEISKVEYEFSNNENN